MQINKDFQGKTSIAKKNDGSIKNASFPSKYNAKENNEFYQDSSLKPFQYSNKKNVNTDVSKSPTLRIKKSKIQEDEYDDEKDKKFKEFLLNMGLPTEYPNYSSLDYWNNRYSSEKGEVCEWLLSFDILRPSIVNLLKKDYGKEILVIGCGNSRVSEQLYNEGYRNITNIDFCKVLIDEMNQKYVQKEEMEFTVMDATEMEYPENCFDIILDKGTFDCILCGESSFEKASSMINSAYMSLKKDGSFVCVSHGGPDTRLGYFQNKQYFWTLKIMEIDKNKIEQLKNFEDETQHYIYICTKN